MGWCGSVWAGAQNDISDFLWMGVDFLWVGVSWCELLWVDVGLCELFMGGCELFMCRCELLWIDVGWCELFMD